MKVYTFFPAKTKKPLTQVQRLHKKKQGGFSNSFPHWLIFKHGNLYFFENNLRGRFACLQPACDLVPFILNLPLLFANSKTPCSRQHFNEKKSGS
ncbi:hypothetical protein FAY30_24605 [Bacillus sp. S3]|nr:hypothetical protein FAY30_24605 [Bacillus sp. S3]